MGSSDPAAIASQRVSLALGTCAFCEMGGAGCSLMEVVLEEEELCLIKGVSNKLGSHCTVWSGS